MTDLSSPPRPKQHGFMRYGGILRIGFKLLVNDKPKFSALLIGITFAVFLMMMMTAMFAGILNRAYSTVTNIPAPIWIMDPAVNTATSCHYAPKPSHPWARSHRSKPATLRDRRFAVSGCFPVLAGNDRGDGKSAQNGGHSMHNDAS